MIKKARFGMRVDPQEKEIWQVMADRMGMSLSEWLTFWAYVGTKIQGAKSNGHFPLSEELFRE